MVLLEMVPYVVNGFVLRLEMLDRLHDLLPLVRYVRPLSSAYSGMPFHYRLNTEIRQQGFYWNPYSSTNTVEPRGQT